MKSPTPFVILASLVVGILFVIKYHTREDRKLLNTLIHSIQEEERNIQLLETDLIHRTRPQIIRERLFAVPTLKPTEPQQIIKLPN
jgi:hypothetical protein